jgi:hypothetical protein
MANKPAASRLKLPGAAAVEGHPEPLPPAVTATLRTIVTALAAQVARDLQVQRTAGPAAPITEIPGGQ